MQATLHACRFKLESASSEKIHSMQPRRRIVSQLGLVALAACLIAAIVPVNRALDARAPQTQSNGDLGPLPDGRSLRILSLGFERVLADLFWIRTVYYMGDERSYQAGYPAADRLAQLVTDIDPEFRTVYVLMGSGLSVLQGNPDGAVRLLEKGVKHVSYWKLHFLLGFTYFFELLEYEKAAEQMALAAELEGAPPYLSLFAGRLYHKAGDPSTAMAMIQARMAEEKNEANRAALEKRYWDLWINRDLARIDQAIAKYRAQHGQLPTNIETLQAAGLLEAVPRDPQGNAYWILNGKATTALEYDELDVFLASGAGQGASEGKSQENQP